jgi:hypothetical protein
MKYGEMRCRLEIDWTAVSVSDTPRCHPKTIRTPEGCQSRVAINLPEPSCLVIAQLLQTTKYPMYGIHNPERVWHGSGTPPGCWAISPSFVPSGHLTAATRSLFPAF